jgi:hypothetical protein
VRAFNLDRPRWGEWIAAIAAVNLLLVTFRAWYEVSGGGGHVTAWDALAHGKYLVIAAAIAGIFLFLVNVTGESKQLSFEPGWITAGIGLACTVYVGYRVANPPSAALEADIGIYVGLISALGVTVGGLLSARESVTEAVGETPTEALATGPGTPAPATAGLVPDTSMPWNPAAPVASTAGWSPASPVVADVPPATAAESTPPSRAADEFGLAALQNGNGASAHEAADDEPTTEKVPWWKREIGGGKKKKKAELGAAAAVGAAVTEIAHTNGSSSEKTSLVKRLFGGRGKDEVVETEAAPAGHPEVAVEPDTTASAHAAESESDATPLTEVAATPDAAGSNVDAAEPAVESAAADESAPEESAVADAQAASPSPDAPVEATAPEDEAVPVHWSPAPAAPIAAAEPVAAGGTSDPTPAERVDAPAPAEDASESASNGWRAPARVDTDAAADGSEPTHAEADAVRDTPEPDLGLDAPAATIAVDDLHTQPRKHSTGSHAVPKVGDAVELTVGGGKFDAGTRGTVVDVFSAGVIVELSGDNGRTERLDVPFEAIAPADA